MSHVCLTAAELQPIEEQLDILVDVCTWFGTARDITVQEFADALVVHDREESLLEPLDFN